MSNGNPNFGLLRAIIDFMNQSGPANSYDSDVVTDALERQGWWADRSRHPKTPRRSVNMYCSQNRAIFENTGKNRYRLRLKFVRAAETPLIDEPDPEQPGRVAQETYRILRDTEMARRLKALHGNTCQIKTCGHCIPLRKGPYSEAHHIQPLGGPHSGPDVAENILVLCPNHHVMCDYGALFLSLDQLAMAPQHPIVQKYLDYHNTRIYRKEA